MVEVLGGILLDDREVRHESHGHLEVVRVQSPGQRLGSLRRSRNGGGAPTLLAPHRGHLGFLGRTYAEVAVNRPLILCAHGAESTRGRGALAGLVNAVRREVQDLDVVDAFVDVQEPTIAEIVAETAGPRAIVPLMLTYDRPVSVDVVQASHLDPAVTVTPPLGPDWVLAEVGVRRLFEAGAGSHDTIVLAADVATNDRAVADLGKAARLLSAVWGGRVHVGTLGGPDTPLAEAVDVARAYGQRVVLSTYLLTPGDVHDHLAAAGADLVTEPLLDGGPPDARIVNLVLARARSRGAWTPVGGDPGPRLAHS